MVRRLIPSCRAIASSFSPAVLALDPHDGRSWHNVAEGLPNLDVTSLITSDGQWLYAGTVGGGVYRITTH